MQSHIDPGSVIFADKDALFETPVFYWRHHRHARVQMAPNFVATPTAEGAQARLGPPGQKNTLMFVLSGEGSSYAPLREGPNAYLEFASLSRAGGYSILSGLDVTDAQIAAFEKGATRFIYKYGLPCHEFSAYPSGGDSRYLPPAGCPWAAQSRLLTNSHGP